MLERVRSGRSARLVIDGAGGFMATPAYPDRGGPFPAALTNALRSLGVTTLMIVEESDLGSYRALDTPTLSAVADTVLQLQVRTTERIRRFPALRKSRVSHCDLRVREVVLTPSGLSVATEEDPPVVR
ncbi:hypothetical protein HK414_08245 [Ramlibacter terrae]|uniref:KaiC-like domain-containing protein n=1 Tax=Ramlibacter terrae TaxID=2732511 RepID=A0ABX6P1L5_9BURK|nr:hypothetical protein HK414_08245 [Ramlibacter terrae]